MTRAEIVQTLTTNGMRRDLATLYADAFLEYQEAAANIATHGAIVAHPRTGNPIENPYLTLRDRARAALQRMSSEQTEPLWTDPEP